MNPTLRIGVALLMVAALMIACEATMTPPADEPEVVVNIGEQTLRFASARGLEPLQVSYGTVPSSVTLGERLDVQVLSRTDPHVTTVIKVIFMDNGWPANPNDPDEIDHTGYAYWINGGGRSSSTASYYVRHAPYQPAQRRIKMVLETFSDLNTVTITGNAERTVNVGQRVPTPDHGCSGPTIRLGDIRDTVIEGDPVSGVVLSSGTMPDPLNDRGHVLWGSVIVEDSSLGTYRLALLFRSGSLRRTAFSSYLADYDDLEGDRARTLSIRVAPNSDTYCADPAIKRVRVINRNPPPAVVEPSPSPPPPLVSWRMNSPLENVIQWQEGTDLAPNDTWQVLYLIHLYDYSGINTTNSWRLKVDRGAALSCRMHIDPAYNTDHIGFESLPGQDMPTASTVIPGRIRWGFNDANWTTYSTEQQIVFDDDSDHIVLSSNNGKYIKMRVKVAC